MKFRFKIIDHPLRYSGRELRSGWVREATGLEGDAAAGFVGECEVANEDLVDMDDMNAGEYIRSKIMAHVIIEHPGCRIAEAVLRQRILVCILCERLAERGVVTRRDGDDVYVKDRKLTVSIAAPSRSSSLIHTGINVDPEGSPVPAVGLAELGVDARDLLDELLTAYGRELAGCAHAQRKVRPVP
jgi:hypothetical protein